jgi:signal transduction histidine kinase
VLLFAAYPIVCLPKSLNHYPMMLLPPARRGPGPVHGAAGATPEDRRELGAAGLCVLCKMSAREGPDDIGRRGSVVRIVVRSTRVAGLVALVMLGGVQPPASAAETLPERPRVLLLYTESRILPAIVKVDEAIRSRIAASGLTPEFLTEYLDLSWGGDRNYPEQLLQFLRVKHGDRKFDVVIAAGAEAFRFALSSRARLFPGTPIVFCGVPPGTVDDHDLPPDVTGVWMMFDGASTLDAAIRLQPGARHVVVVGGAAAADKLYVRGVERQLAGRLSGRDVTYLEGLTLEDLRERLSRLSGDTIVLFVSIARDGAGRVFVPSEALRLIAPFSRAPIYGVADTFIGLGIVGGYLVNFETQGTRAADIAVRLLRRDPGWRVAPALAGNVYTFDARQLERWGLSEASLPPGSVVVNRTRSLWAQYRWWIVAATAMIGLQALLIVGLLVQRRRRRRAETILRDRLGFETLVSGLTATFVGRPGGDILPGVQDGLRRVGEHLGLDRATIVQAARQGDVVEVVHAWVAPGVPPPPAPIPLARLPWALARLGRGEIVRFERVSELPDEAAVDRHTLAMLGITAAVSIPLMAGGNRLGALTLTLLGRERAWPDDLVERLQFVAGIFSSALLHYRHVNELAMLRRDLNHVGRVASMGELAASFAHELNQPLTAILSNAEAAEQMIDEGIHDLKSLREIVADIAADDQRASEIIRRLRAFVKKDQSFRAPVDINAVIGDVVSLLQNDAIIHGVTVDVDGLDAQLPPVLVDRVQVQQVIVNLMMNALEAVRGASERRIVVGATRADSAIQVRVTDSGGGIAAADLEQIFAPFYTTKPSGLGMGLSIARSLIEGHGGRLSVHSAPGRGATFVLTLPAMPRDR